MMLERGTIAKLKKLIPRLATEHDGEVVATVRAIRRVLESSGASLHDLSASFDAGPVQGNALSVSHNDILRIGPHLLENCGLSVREREFVLSLVIWARRKRKKFTVTDKQADWWLAICDEHLQSKD